MAGPRAYNVLYRWHVARALWSNADRWEIRELVEGGPCSPTLLAPAPGVSPRAVDLGCGEGSVAIYLASKGFATVGIDFSGAALRMARAAAARAGVDDGQLRFVQGDLTQRSVPGVEGPFDLLVDYGTLDDLKPNERLGMARLIDGLSRPESRFLLYAFCARLEDLPLFSLGGPSRLAPERLEPGEVEQLFGAGWEIRRLSREGSRFVATFLLTKRERPQAQATQA